VYATLYARCADMCRFVRHTLPTPRSSASAQIAGLTPSGVERCASWVGSQLKPGLFMRQRGLVCRDDARHFASHLRCCGGCRQG